MGDSEEVYKSLGVEETHPMDASNHLIPTSDFSDDNSPISPDDHQATLPEPPSDGGSITLPTDPQSEPSQSEPRRKKCMKVEKLMTMVEFPVNEKWNWRKYGQKVIRGSPYPRHYYRCSTLKECTAKMHMTIKTLDDPIIYEMHYLGEHNHAEPVHRRMAFIGKTRVKKSKLKRSPNPPSTTYHEELQQEPNDYTAMEVDDISVERLSEEGNVDSEICYYNDEEFKIELIPNAQVMEDTFMGFKELGIMHNF